MKPKKVRGKACYRASEGEANVVVHGGTARLKDIGVGITGKKGGRVMQRQDSW